jgi:acetone carboxylase alpha subunit
VLPKYAERVYGAVIKQDKNAVWSVDAAATEKRRAGIRQERLARSVPTREWMEERERIVTKHAAVQVKHMFATNFGLSEKFKADFKKFWNLPEEWDLQEKELGVPSYGAEYRMDLSKLPDVRTVVLVEE